MTKYVVAVHYLGEDIELEEVYASSRIMAAKALVDTLDWGDQPESFKELQRTFWHLCEGYVSVIEINKPSLGPGSLPPIGQIAVQ